jgi:soluble lytic murein transglycosylase-like protein
MYAPSRYTGFNPPAVNRRGSTPWVRRGLGDVSSIQQLIASTANQYGIPPSIALAVAQIESGFNQSAVNAGGDTGVMQISPATAVTLGIDPTDLNQNVQGGVSYLAKLYAQFGDWGTALAAYNCGPGNPQGCTSYANKVIAAQPDYTSFDSSADVADSSGAGSSSFDVSSLLPDLSNLDSTTVWIALGAVGLVGLWVALR